MTIHNYIFEMIKIITSIFGIKCFNLYLFLKFCKYHYMETYSDDDDFVYLVYPTVSLIINKGNFKVFQ